MGTHDGAVNVIYGTGDGLSITDNQLWSQDSPGILDQAESGDHFGWSLSSASPASGNSGESRPDYWPNGSGF